MERVSIAYMVAGLSSRFGGEIKQFAEIGPNEETLIEISLDQAIRAGFSRIMFIVGKLTEKPFRDKFGSNYKGIPVEYVLQDFDSEKRDKPWGTFDALCCLKGRVEGGFVICNGDDLYGEHTFRTLVEHLRDKKSAASVGYVLRDALPSNGLGNRGIFKLDSCRKVDSVREVLGIGQYNLAELGISPESLCSMNIWAFFSENLEVFFESLEKFKKENFGDRKVECLLPEQINELIKKGLEIELYSASDKWIGITRKEDVESVKALLRDLDF